MLPSFERARRASTLLLALLLAGGACGGGSGDASPTGAGGAGGRGGTVGSTGGRGGGSGTGGSVAGSGGSSGGSGGSVAGSGGSTATDSGSAPDAGGPASDVGGPSPDVGEPPAIADDPLPPCKRMVPVPDSAALGGTVASAMPGDCLIAANGDYGAITISAKGTAAAPIVLRAATRGMAVFTGRVTLTGAEYVVIEGFNHSGAAGVTVTNSNNNRITRSRFRLAGGTFVSLTGTSNANRIDHNEFGPLGAEGHYINPTGMSERTRIDHNYLHDLAPCGGNGCETISLGCCGAAADAHETFNVVEYNLLVNCDGESEMIGMKSSSNTVRFNTIRSSRGQISFRAGKKNIVHSNYMLGEGKAGTQGIRMLDEDHLVYNNYVDVQAFPLRMQHGDVPGFPPIRRARVINNTFVVGGAPVELGGTAHSIAPMDSTFANNLIIGTGTLISEKTNGIVLQNNVAFSMGGSVGVTKPADQLRVVDPKVTKMGTLWRAGPGSVLIDAAIGNFPFVTHDVDGLPRMQADIGAHEAGGMGKGPLTVADVGPDAP